MSHTPNTLEHVFAAAQAEHEAKLTELVRYLARRAAEHDFKPDTQNPERAESNDD